MSVGVVHRLEMTDEDARAWGEHFAQYEKLPPFDQIGRATHATEPAALARFANAALAKDGKHRIDLAGPARIARVTPARAASRIAFSELVRELDDVLA